MQKGNNISHLIANDLLMEHMEKDVLIIIRLSHLKAQKDNNLG